MKGGPEGTDGPKLSEPSPLLRDWDGRPVEVSANINSELLRLQREVGEERGERVALEQLMAEIAEALRPVRGGNPLEGGGLWSKAASQAQAVLDAYAAARAPVAAEPQQAMGSPEEEPDVAFYRRKAQHIREQLEIEITKVVDRDRRIEELEEALRSRDEKHEDLTRHYLREQEKAEAGRDALREMAKLL